MTFGGWLIFGFIVLLIGTLAAGALCMLDLSNNTLDIILRVLIIIFAVILVIGSLFGLRWYFNNTAAGQRAMIDQKSNFKNGLERTVTVYTANGDIIAQYQGQIDIEGNDGGYVIFDFEGKRYMYYNCFVESIADIS